MVIGYIRDPVIGPVIWKKRIFGRNHDRALAEGLSFFNILTQALIVVSRVSRVVLQGCPKGPP